ncbi:MAG: methyltransferase domain-containing protein [Phycisphaerales bacterium]|nr:methyltransferase domain-containing protein [Phycisphaerales bacterium]MCB9856462.1 methyltransferase domain-containing protein [Phycisphaerales bacterium]
MLEKRLYHDRGWIHPYAQLRRQVVDRLNASARILEIGCGRDFAEAKQYLTKTPHAIGLDPAIAAGDRRQGARVRGFGDRLPFADASFDVIVCRSVIEHLMDPLAFFAESARVLKQGGAMFCLTPNRWDYASIVAGMVPNRWHGRIVRFAEGRDEADTFPTYYRANSERALRRIAKMTGLAIRQLEHLNHSPSYLTFSPLLYRVGAAYDRAISATPKLASLRAWLFAEFGKA